MVPQAHENGPTATCPICLSSGPCATHAATEHMHGLPGTFVYRECGACGSLWLPDPPALDAYYPRDYYSFEANGDGGRRGRRLILWAVQELHARRFIALLGRFGLRRERDQAILDVGSGAGNLLRGLRRHRFANLTGVDPYLTAPFSARGLRLLRASLEGADGQFDLIVFNHSLEHVPDVESALKAARGLLSPGGHAIVRIPVPNYAWRRFGANWMGLDAPRHLHLMTEQGLSRVSERSGFRVTACVYDSSASQFWGSRAYERGLTLRQAVPTGFFPLALNVVGRARWLPAAWHLNRRRLGDQASFLLTPL